MARHCGAGFPACTSEYSYVQAGKPAPQWRPRRTRGLHIHPLSTQHFLPPELAMLSVPPLAFRSRRVAAPSAAAPTPPPPPVALTLVAAVYQTEQYVRLTFDRAV